MFLYGVLWVGWVGGSPCGIAVATLLCALAFVLVTWKNKHFDFENFVGLLCFILVFQMWYLETSVVTEFSFQLHLFALELLDIQCDTVLYFGICILRCLSDLSLSTCEIQLFHSSTGLIVLSARPAHPVCGGGTL